MHYERLSDIDDDNLWLIGTNQRQTFGDLYDLGKKLGGRFGSFICICRRKSFSVSNAVKIIDKNEKTRRSKVDIKQCLQHMNENVVRLLDVFETPKQIILIQELTSGGELFDRIVVMGHYSERVAANAVHQILNGLAVLHKFGIVHNNLKPENLLYADSSETAPLKISDHCLSTIFANEIIKQRMRDSPEYCAPEMFDGRITSSSVDIWSVGVITYILLCGYQPFQHNQRNMLFKQILKGNFKFTSPAWDSITENGKDFVKRLLSVDVYKRPTVRQALVHPWARGIAAKHEYLEDTQRKIKEFNHKRKQSIQ
ncbi:hypothetical protein ACJMK2_044667 [Sinanodonta woodiana]|uniref:Protein kinase domain-containing protein n=1 Tax=Sinanodonta woodiana TaxID=1069815 RepID=A0ABD3W1M8_SINWO